MSDTSVGIWWVRRDLRLRDNPALVAACRAGAVIPVFILDERFETLGAAPRWRLAESLKELANELEANGSRLVLRRGAALGVLEELVKESGATEVHWMRLYDPFSRQADAAVKTSLKEAGLIAESHAGHLLQEPWQVKTQTGDFYKVFTPFWKNLRQLEVPWPLAAPSALHAPAHWPKSDALGAWELGREMNRGAEILSKHVTAGEAAALSKLEAFLDGPVDTYKDARDRVDMHGTSELSDNLSLGEISPRMIWHVSKQAEASGAKGVEAFLREVGWRDFAQHLMYHTPQMLTENWREGWDEFPWCEDEHSDAVTAWKYGRTGVDFVDAAMRELWVSGKMHNRARMIAASYLTKHLMVHWRVGERWFADQLVDYDPASNAMGWQWVAGSGPDAAPYFRIFNPDTQLEKFDPKRRYYRSWIAEGDPDPSETALEFFEAIPRSAGLSRSDGRPSAPIVGLKEGRARALEAYSAR